MPVCLLACGLAIHKHFSHFGIFAGFAASFVFDCAFCIFRFLSLVSVICFLHMRQAKRQLWEIFKPEIHVAPVKLLLHKVPPSPAPRDTHNRMSFYKVFRFSSLGQPRCQTSRRLICFDSFSSNYLEHCREVLKVFGILKFDMVNIASNHAASFLSILFSKTCVY